MQAIAKTSLESSSVLLGNSATTVALRRNIEIAARSSAKVLILGETGAGKEVVARSIHDESARRSRPFVAVNCSGIPETLLESELFGHVRGSFTGAYRDKPGVIRQAHGGTLFLDELGEMSPRMQAVLLRFAESGEMHPVGADAPAAPSDVRLITATNRDLRAQIETGSFRQDLYYRLNVIEIRVLPLRERRDDIPELLRHYLDRAAEMHGTSRPTLTDAAEEALVEYSWPGNVRELKNIAERLALADWRRAIAADDLPFEVRMNGKPVFVAPAPTREQWPATTPVTRPTAPGQSSPTVARLFDRFAAGEDFWTVIYQPFKARELTRQDLMDLIDAGLRKTGGSYRDLLGVFNLPITQYKRFHAFLYQHNCNLPVGTYRRMAKADATPARVPRRAGAAC
jgi:transcriptional regulator with PAS, ATPase and Fis domain